MSDRRPLRVGVVGVGNMGAHHARVYSELKDVDLVGVADADVDRADAVAEEHGTIPRPTEALIADADAVSIAVPTAAHYDIARQCLDAETDILVEKPFVDDLAEGRRLARMADDRDLILQVGHIERFNPAVEAMLDLVDPSDIVAVRADRLGPPVGRAVSDGVVMDLMIHDIDLLLHLMGERPERLAGVSREESYASVLFEFENDAVATITASRVTQRKVRSMAVTIPDRHIVVDFIDQSIKIHRRSRPAYLQDETDMRYRHESIIEQPLIESAEPLKIELGSFLEAVRERRPPVVTADEGLRAISVVEGIRRKCADATLEVSPR